MSLKAIMEIAKAQNNIEALADELAMQIDASRLHASTNVISEKAFLVTIEQATAEEVVGLVSNYLAVADDDSDVTVVESKDGSGAVVIFNDTDGAETASLEAASVILEIAGKLEEDEDDDDEGHVAEEDDDVDMSGDEEDDDDDAEVDDPDTLKIVHEDEGFKLATRLQQLACGPSKKDFHTFMKDMDNLLMKYRNRSGYEPQQENAATFTFDDLEEAALNSIFETAKKKGKKGFKEGRSGFLSAFMTIVSKRGDDLAEAWDALDPDTMSTLIGEVGGELLDLISDERVKRGLDSGRLDDQDAEVTTDTAAEIVNK